VTDLQGILLGLLSLHCRGPALARKAWKVAEDLRALGLDIGPQALLDALADLRRQGFPVALTDGDPPAAYIEERPRERDRSDWRTGRRPHRMARAVRPTAEARLLAEAEKAYRGFLDAALARAQVSARVRRAACGRRRGPCWRNAEVQEVGM
jgi:hypothetical protein